MNRSPRRRRDSDGKGEQLALVLQGGGALGAYQAGAYEALAGADLVPHWVAGISIGGINAAIIAGNSPENRIERLRRFWERVSSQLVGRPIDSGTQSRELFNWMSASYVTAAGVPGFFRPRYPPAALMPPGAPEALSVYDTAPLGASLREFVDFDILNSGAVRLSVGAVNVRSGNFVYFDTDSRSIGPEHIMASAALPPGLPPITIEGEAYWDGGTVSNTPLEYILEYAGPREDMCIFQIDLFSARGAMPQTLLEVSEREKEIRYSSRTRLNTDSFLEMQSLRRAARRVIGKLPKALHRDPDVQELEELSCDAAVTIVHLIYRRAAYEGHAHDFEFSRASVEEHWEAGRNDVRRTLRNRRWREREKPRQGVTVLDLARDVME